LATRCIYGATCVSDEKAPKMMLLDAKRRPGGPHMSKYKNLTENQHTRCEDKLGSLLIRPQCNFLLKLI